ncbi:MAG: TetR/AcrR family transcriptional regulator [Thermoanaerobaculia bacterium]
MTPRRNAEATRTAILDAAERLFLERGPAAASMSAVAQAAGVTKSLIHHHFGSKEGLWTAVKDRRFEVYAELQRRLLTEPTSTADLLKRSMEAYFRFQSKNPEFARFRSWLRLETQDSPPFGQGEELVRLGVAKVREAQERGELRSDVHPFSILTSLLGVIDHWFEDRPVRVALAETLAGLPDDEAYLRELLAMFFQGILPETG